MKQHQNKKTLFRKNIFKCIDWGSLGKVLSDPTPTFSKWYSKHTANSCGTAQMLFRMKLLDTDECQCCLQLTEHNLDHCLSCPHPTIVQVKSKDYKSVLQWISSPLIDQDVSFALSLFLKHIPWPKEWLSSLSIPQQHSLRILAAIRCNTFLHGYIPTFFSQWQELQRQESMSGLTGRIFFSQLIRKLLLAKTKYRKTRCKLIHDRAKGVLYMDEEKLIQDAVSQEFNQSFDNITSEHLHLTIFSK